MSNIKELNIEEFSAPAYLTYAIKTVLDRAIPDVEDGMKPVQRRILYAMQELRLNNNAKPVKSARVVGNVIGMYHPHGDSSVYEAMVRMSQPWVMRYPLIEGEGNFGSRDGDPAAAMRYTEARLMPIAAALLEELDSDTVDFQPNYDNSRMEPQLLPARLPFMLLNGALGIAVGMQTLTVSHNLREVVEACKLIINKKGTTLDDVLSVMPGPDFATGAQLISSADEIKKVYQDGRGPLRIRGCWTIERMGKNNKDWQMVITQLPPEVSTKDIMEQIEELVNPTQKEKGGKKQPLTAEQVRLKKMFSDMIEEVVDGRDLENPLNIIITPKNRSVDPEVLSSALCSYTDLEKNVNMNMVLVDLEGNPHRGGLLDWMNEWCIQRVRTFRRRIIFEKKKIDHRLHIIAGRLSILDRIEEVIRVLKKSKQPKEDLMSNFGLDEIQAEDVLEMRLRQLAGLEKDKLLAEQAEKIKEQTRLAKLLADEKLLRKEIIKELEQDAKAFGDDRRTLIEESRSATSRKDFVAQSASVGPEPIAIALTERGWISWKSVKTKEEALSAEFKMKTGDAVKRVYFGDRADNLVLVSQTGRAYSIPLRSSELDGKGDTLPLTQFFNFEGNDKIVEGAIAGNDEKFLVSTSAGFGFITSSNTWINRMKAGKEFMSLTEGATPLPPIPLKEFKDYEQSKVVVLSSDGRSVAFDFSELKEFPKSKGFALIGLDQDQEMVDITLHTTENPAKFINKKGKEVSFKDEEINEIYGKRSSSKKGKVLHKDLKGSLFERLGRDKSNPIIE